MTDAQGPSEDGGRRSWLPHFSRAGKWLVATVATATIGVLVPTVLAGWLGTGDDDDEQAATPTASATAIPFPPSRQVSQEKIGLFNVESDGTPQGAQAAFGPPSESTSERLSCTMRWEADGVEVRFYDLGGGDPCVDGDFCSATISGREWATTKGLQIGESARRVEELYPDAEKIQEPGVVIRWVLEEGVSPCGVDAKGGLEANSGGGRIFSLEVSYAKGGD
ncbi:MAG TPA: hypothetical protein VHJ39_05090 [Solirubrobacteraceae bacterium]|nr:hypothetical protein [Solirubrobacteraceae bacterium]